MLAGAGAFGTMPGAAENNAGPNGDFGAALGEAAGLLGSGVTAPGDRTESRNDVTGTSGLCGAGAPADAACRATGSQVSGAGTAVGIGAGCESSATGRAAGREAGRAAGSPAGASVVANGPGGGGGGNGVDVDWFTQKYRHPTCQT